MSADFLLKNKQIWVTCTSGRAMLVSVSESLYTHLQINPTCLSKKKKRLNHALFRLFKSDGDSKEGGCGQSEQRKVGIIRLFPRYDRNIIGSHSCAASRWLRGTLRLTEPLSEREGRRRTHTVIRWSWDSLRRKDSLWWKSLPSHEKKTPQGCSVHERPSVGVEGRVWLRCSCWCSRLSPSAHIRCRAFALFVLVGLYTNVKGATKKYQFIKIYLYLQSALECCLCNTNAGQ